MQHRRLIYRNVINVILVLGILAPAIAIGALIVQERKQESRRKAAEAARAVEVEKNGKQDDASAPGPMMIKLDRNQIEQAKKMAAAARAAKRDAAGQTASAPRARRPSSPGSADSAVRPFDLDGAAPETGITTNASVPEPSLDKVLDRLFVRRDANRPREIQLRF